MHMSQQVSGSYPGASREQFPPSATQATSGVQGVPAEMQLSPRAVRVGSPVVKRMTSSTGAPTYYYYYAPSATSSPVSRSSAVSTPPPAMSPIASGPHSPNLVHHQLHHRQLPSAPTPSSPFLFPQHSQHQQQQHQYYGPMASVVEEQQQSSPVSHHHTPSSLQHHQPYGIHAHPALLQQSHCFFSPPASPSPPRTPPPSHPMVQHSQRMVQTPSPSPVSIGQRQVTVPQAHQQPQRNATRTTIASGTSAVAIDNKIEQAMDLVKSHLMFAVREEVEVLKEKIAELMERINQLEAENSILKANASTETLAQLGGGGQAQAS